jgi:GT2 family glycosyltransferase
MSRAISSRAGSRVNRLSPAASLPDVDCIVVNQDGGDALFDLLRSVANQTGIDLSLVVVDNGSRSEEKERIAREAPSARIVAFSRNLGFAAGANEGIARTRAPLVLVVNNDVVLSPDYVSRLAARLLLDDRLAAVQGLVLRQDSDRVDTAGIEWNERGEAVPVLSGAEVSHAEASAFEVTGVSATAALYRREALEDIAPHGRVFDDRFFAYYEDVDLSLRLARAGWRFACDPAARARHEGSRTGGRRPFRRALWTARNRWRTLFGNFEGRWLRRNLLNLLRADLAHARRLGLRGILLPVAIWPRIPFLALAAARRSDLLGAWPAPGDRRREPVAAAASNG